MATELASAFVSLVPSFKGGQAAIAKELDGAAGGAGKSAGKRFGGGILGAVKGIAGPLAGAFAGLGAAKFLGDVIGEAREAAKVGRLTAAVIKSTGGAANVSAGQIGDLAEALSNKAGVDDELVQSGANVLLTFTKIRNEAGKGNDVFDQATTSALDMSVALGTDMKSASILVGKALNDPIRGVTALGRSGVQFTEAQKEQIKTMVESGDTMGAQKLILAELTTQFGGAAAAAADPAEKAQVAWGNFKEEIGTAVLPAFEGLIGFFTGTALPAVKSLIAGLKGGGDDSAFATVGRTVRGVVLFIKDDAIPTIRAFAGWIDRNRKPLLIIAGVITAIYLPALIAAGVQATISAAKQVAAWAISAAGSVASGAAMSLTVVKVVAGWVLMGTQALLNAARMALAWLIALGPIGLIIAAVIALVAIIILNWETIWTWTKKIFTAVWNFLKGLWDTVVAFIGKAISFIKDIFFRFHPVGIIARNWEPIWGFVKGLWNRVFGFVKSIPGRITGFLSGMWDVVKSGARTAMNAAIGLINGAIGGLNVLIGTINKIPGVSIPSISPLPMLAKGGIVRATPGGVAAILGEGGQDEAVIPLDKLASMMGSPSGGVFEGDLFLDSGEWLGKVRGEVRQEMSRSNSNTVRRVGAGAGRAA